MTPSRSPRGSVRAAWWCVAATFGCAAASAVGAATVSEKAKESGCVSKPVVVAGTTYKCFTESGAKSYFNVVGAPVADPPDTNPRKSAARALADRLPQGRPRDAEGRDDVHGRSGRRTRDRGKALGEAHRIRGWCTGGCPRRSNVEIPRAHPGCGSRSTCTGKTSGAQGARLRQVARSLGTCALRAR
jgi:hypothetical protein